MLDSEKFAIAAHLHVVLRRVNGRVTDVEWMIRSAEYAREVIRVARTEDHPELLRLADKLESALLPPAPVAKAERRAPPPAAIPSEASDFGASRFASSDLEPAVPRQRYVGTLR
jgi:hypothetical protein